MAGIKVQTGELVKDRHDAKHQVDGLVLPTVSPEKAKMFSEMPTLVVKAYSGNRWESKQSKQVIGVRVIGVK